MIRHEPFELPTQTQPEMAEEAAEMLPEPGEPVPKAAEIYRSRTGSRVLRVLKALDAHPIIGVSNKEIADSVGMSAANVTRALSDLIAEGLVQKLDNGNFAYSVKMLQIAERFRQQQARLTAKLEEMADRVNRF